MGLYSAPRDAYVHHRLLPTSARPARGRGRDGATWLVDGAILPVDAGVRYGLYLASEPGRDLAFADLHCWYYPVPVEVVAPPPLP